MSPVDPLGGLGHPGHGGANLPGDPSPPTRRPPAGPGAPQGPRVGFRLQASGTPTAWALVLVLGGFFIAQCALGDWNMEDPLALFRLGALHWLSVLDGDFFRLGAYSFLHIGVAHFLLNAYALWILMRPIELSYGSVSALGIYAAAVIGGGAASMAWAIHSNNAFMLAAGASGGIFGLFGAQISLWLRLRSRLPPEASKLAVRGLVMNLLLNVFISWQAAANGMALDNSAHLGGIATGLFFGLAAPLAVLPGRFWQKPAQALLVLATFALASMEGAAVARAIHPHTRLLQGPGVAADAPWMLVPATPGIAVGPGGIGMEASIARLAEPLALVEGSDALRVGERTWARTRSAGEQGETLLTLRAQEGSGSLRIEVICATETCRGGLADDAALQLAKSIRAE